MTKESGITVMLTWVIMTKRRYSQYESAVIGQTKSAAYQINVFFE